MSDYPSLQFVSAPSSTAVLRYDFNADDSGARCSVLGAGDLDLGTPSFSGEPEGVGADYGYRSMRFVQRIQGSKAVALSRQSALARELLRPTNWLRFQWNPLLQPVYFRTYRGEPGSLGVEHGDTADAWDITVPLVAEGFAYGARVTIPSALMVQAPADLTTPTRYAMSYTLPPIKGDAPTGLRVTVTPDAGSNAASTESSWLIASHSGESYMSLPVASIGTGDAFTAVTGVSAGVSDAAYFGGSYRTITINSGANIVERFRGTLPAVPIGRYKVLMRIEADAAASTTKPFVFYLGYPDTVNGPTWVSKVTHKVGLVTIGSAQTFQGWVDLGEINLPTAGAFIPPDLAGATTAYTAGVTIAAGTADGSAGTVRVDALKLLPVDGPSVIATSILKPSWATRQTALANGSAGTFDADTQMIWQQVGPILQSAPRAVGSFPYADPRAPRNVVTVMATSRGYISSTPWITSLAAQSTLDISYNPRWLYVGDGT